MKTSKSCSVSITASLSVLAFSILCLQPVRADLVTHLALNGDLVDEGPAGNDGTFVSATAPLDPAFEDGFDGTIGGALTFDGVDDYVLLTPSDGLPLTHFPAFTVAMWVKGVGTGQSDKRVFSESSDVAGNPLFNLGTHNTGADGTVDNFIRTSTATIHNHFHSTGIAFDGLWHHIAWVDDNGAVTLYIDGIADATNFNYTRPVQEMAITTLGGIYRPSHTTVTCCFFTGAIDDVQLFDHALTELEVKAIMVPPGGCPTVGDTTCDDIAVNGPTGEPGLYTLSVENAVDTSGDAIIYTFSADDGAGTVLKAGPQAETTAQFTLTAGTWTVSVTVDDDLACEDVAAGATRSRTLTVSPCPAAGDTTVSGLTVTGPAGNFPGNYQIKATGAADANGSPILYTYTADNGVDAPWVYGPYTDIDEILLGLRPGTWTLSVAVDDNPACDDPVDTASTSITVNAPAPALVSHWKMDGDLSDERPAGNDGTFVGDALGPNFVEGFDAASPGAVRLDGIDDRIDLTQDQGLPIHANKAYTVAMWVKGLPGQTDRRVFSEGNALAGGGGAPAHPQNINPLFNIGTHNTGADGTVDIYIRGDLGQNPINHGHTARTAFDDTWHHIAWVDDDGNGRVYIDAVRDQTSYRYIRPLLTVDATTIGAILRGGPSHWFAGDVDDVRVYNYALTETEIVALVPEASGCPGDADTTVSDITVTPPVYGTFPGSYTLTAAGAADGSGDPILYTFVAERASDGAYIQVGPDVNDFAQMSLTAGNWKLTLKVDDDLRCRDDSPSSVRTKDYTVSEVPRELISHWKFDGDLSDSGVGGNDGATVAGGVPVFGEDHEGNAESAICLDGLTNDYIQAVINEELPIYTNIKLSAFSIAAWVKGPPQVDRRIYAEGSTASNTPLFTIGTDNSDTDAAGLTGQLDIYVRTDANTAPVPHLHSQGIAFDDTWHHIAYVDSSGQAAVYIDGVLDATNFNYTKGTLTLDTTAIGGVLRAASCCLFQGCIDDVRVFSYALSEEEVKDAMEGGGGPVVPIFHRGDPNNDGATNITDGIYILNFLFLGGPPPTCKESADPNNDGAVNITDGIYVLNYLFLGGVEPVAPKAPGKGPCGPDTDAPGSPKDLGCATYTKC